MAERDEEIERLDAEYEDALEIDPAMEDGSELICIQAPDGMDQFNNVLFLIRRKRWELIKQFAQRMKCGAVSFPIYCYSVYPLLNECKVVASGITDLKIIDFILSVENLGFIADIRQMIQDDYHGH